MNGKKILLVEDDEDLAHLIKILLRSHQYEVDTAMTGERALDLVREHQDLVLLDRGLPDMEGMEICRKIREDGRTRSIPVIMLTGRSSPVDKLEGLYIGADEYITKPFECEELLARVEAVIRRYHFAEQSRQDRDALIRELSRILKGRMITPFFQPIRSLSDERLLGFEVFSRPPLNSILNNAEILFKVALNFGMYPELETLCWGKAIDRKNVCGYAGKIFLNCTPYFIESHHFDVAAFKELNINPQEVVLEITERGGVQDYGTFLKKLQVFKEAGVKIAVDDVGCGYASLDTVAQVNPDFVKIDKPLIRDIHIDGLRLGIVESINNFCRKSGILTIAEGVESKEELEKLRQLGIDAAQGYYLGHPQKEIVK
jgi:EAL domain-containing protein (putative c-di-GMP-specific phosphodiesterase class I)/CheY-like chemotaxis protein